MNALIAQVKDGMKKGETMGNKYIPTPNWTHESPKVTPPPIFKPFDLIPGDTIIATTENVKGGKFKVTAIYPNIIVTEREAAENYKEAFPIIDYISGKIKKVAK